MNSEQAGLSDHGGPGRSIPTRIASGCPELDTVWEKYSSIILDRLQVLIPDTEDDLNWHAFLGHSVDMQGFRAAEFAGVDPPTRLAPGFIPLRQRGLGVPELGGLWKIPAIRQHLLTGAKGSPLQTTLEVLKAEGGEAGRSLAEAFQRFPFRKGHWTVRALLQNSATLEDHGYSLRRWLRHECEALGVAEFPPPDFRMAVTLRGRSLPLEKALRARLEQTFYQVGPALSPYMLCDWQLWLWKEMRTGVFANFKLDSFHEDFVRRYGRGVVPPDEDGFARWWLSLYPDLPPRIANECIWLGVEHRDV